MRQKRIIVIASTYFVVGYLLILLLHVPRFQVRAGVYQAIFLSVWLVPSLASLALALDLLHSRASRRRLLLAIVTMFVFFNGFFALTYDFMGRGTQGEFNVALTLTDALYFELGVFTTAGFGDIRPVTQTGRLVVAIQMIADLVFVAVVLGAFVSRVIAPEKVTDEE